MGSLHAQTTETPKKFLVKPIDAVQPVQLKVPAPYQKKGTKIRIKNRVTGKQSILEMGTGGAAKINDEQFLTSEALRELTDNHTTDLVPEISVLQKSDRVVQPRGRSLILDQWEWRPLGFSALQRDGKVEISLDSHIKNSYLAPQEAAERRSLIEDSGVRRLFELGWSALQKKRPDLASQAFGRILLRHDRLTEAQRAQAHLGQGIATFHQKGCVAAEADFQRADRDRSNSDDVSYFRALCLVEAKKYQEAEILFQELIKKQNAKYAEPSRFYVGVVAEHEDRFEQAETAYMDTIDFAEDPALVELAKSRLARLKEAKGDRDYSKKWISFMASAGLGYDNNVVALPRELSPESVRIKSQKSLSTLGLGLVDVSLPISKKFENHLRYSFLALHYLSTDIARGNDVQAHDLNASVDFFVSNKDKVAATLAYTSILLGTIRQSEQYIASPSVELRQTHYRGKSQAPYAFYENYFRYTKVDYKRTPNSEREDITANAYLYGYKYTVLDVKNHVFGPAFEMEYHPAKGKDISYYAGTLIGHWTLPVGPQKWRLSLTQEGAAQYTSYYHHISDRRDWMLRYKSSLARPWGNRFETRLQFTGLLSLSNLKSSYQYDKATLGILVSALF